MHFRLQVSIVINRNFLLFDYRIYLIQQNLMKRKEINKKGKVVKVRKQLEAA